MFSSNHTHKKDVVLKESFVPCLFQWQGNYRNRVRQKKTPSVPKKYGRSRARWGDRVSTERQDQTLERLQSQFSLTTLLPTSLSWCQNTLHRKTLKLCHTWPLSSLICLHVIFFSVLHTKKWLHGRVFIKRPALGPVIIQRLPHTCQNDSRCAFLQWIVWLKKCVTVEGGFFERLHWNINLTD